MRRRKLTKRQQLEARIATLQKRVRELQAEVSAESSARHRTDDEYLMVVKALSLAVSGKSQKELAAYVKGLSDQRIARILQ